MLKLGVQDSKSILKWVLAQGDAQARRLGIRVKGEAANYYPHTLNNTVLASTRALIALIENNYKDGVVTIPEVLRPYMGGKEKLEK